MEQRPVIFSHRLGGGWWRWRCLRAWQSPNATIGTSRPHHSGAYGPISPRPSVKRLADLLGHGIDVHSIPGRGSCFAMSLPLTHSQPSVPVPPTVAPSGNQLQGRYILILDDQPIVLTSTEHLLKHWGCRVSAASAIEQAEEQCRSEPPELLIVDYRLPDNLTGIEAIGRLHRILGTETPALIITGDTSPERLREAGDSGYTLLHKPIQPSRLRSTIEHLLESATERPDTNGDTQSPTAVQAPLLKPATPS